MKIKDNFFNFNSDNSSGKKIAPENITVSKKEIDKETPVDPKFWQSKTGISFGNNGDLGKEEENNNVDKLISLCSDYKPDSSILSLINKLNINRLCILIQDGKIAPQNLFNIFKKLSLTKASDNNYLNELISTIYDSCKEARLGKENSEYICNLASPFLISENIAPYDFCQQIKNSTTLKREITKFFAENGRRDKDCIFSNVSDYDTQVEMLDEANVEDYRSSFINRSAYMLPSDITNMMQLFINPKTKRYDSKLDEAARDFHKRNQQTKGLESLSELNSANIVRAMVEDATGTISEDAIKFTNDYYFGMKENENSSIFSSIVKKISSQPSDTDNIYYKNSDSLHTNFHFILDDLKDNSGFFNKSNIKYMEKLMESTSGWLAADDRITFFNYLKDENGVVEKSKFDFAKNFLEESNDWQKTSEIVQLYVKLGKNNFSKRYKYLWKLYNKNNFLFYDNVTVLARNCFYEDGSPKKDIINLIRTITDDFSQYIDFSDFMFDLMQDQYCVDLILKMKENEVLSEPQLSGLALIKQNYSDEKGEINPHVKEKVGEFVEKGISLVNFNDIYGNCFIEDENKNKHFDEELYKNILNIILLKDDGNRQIGRQILRVLGTDNIIELAKGGLSINKLKFKTKLDLYERFKTVNFKELEKKLPVVKNLENLFYEIDTSLTREIHCLPVENNDIQNFIHSVLASGQNGDFSDFETILKNSITDLKSMKNGLPISYSRKDFISDLSALCDSEEKIRTLENKTDISVNFEKDDSSINITGYDGIISLDKLNRSDDFENKIYELCHRFMYGNEVKTRNAELDKQLNIILKAAPEFINTIGKKQHGTHKYTLDIHQLLVLANSINNPNYTKLNELDRTMLKILALFHDIAKKEGVVDKGHQEPSSLYIRSIIKKIIKNPETIERFYELVKNHHWLEEYTTAGATEEAAQKIAFKFRRPNDFEIEKIMAFSDLMSVSDEFYERLKGALDEDKLKLIDEKLQALYSSGNAIFSDYVVTPSQLEKHKETYAGKEYKVVNLHKLQDEDSLAEYGFRNVKKKDAKFLVHMLPEDNVKNYIEIIRQLTSSVNGGVLSESLITPEYKRTYSNRKFGVLLSQINPNIVNTASKNQGSGLAKDMGNAVKLIFSPNNKNRRNFKDALLKNLGIEPKNISDEDFAKFYKENIALKTSLFNFVDSKEYILGEYRITGKQLKEAIEKYQDSLIDKKEEHHNEIVGYVPKIQGIIAKANSLSEIPQNLLDFAYKNNYPVILI